MYSVVVPRYRTWPACEPVARPALCAYSKMSTLPKMRSLTPSVIVLCHFGLGVSPRSHARSWTPRLSHSMLQVEGRLAYVMVRTCFPPILTVFVNLIPGGAVSFTPVRLMYFTASAAPVLLTLQQFAPSSCDGAAHDYWGHPPCSRRRRHMLTEWTRTCCDVVFETLINICVIAVCSHTTAYQDIKAHSNARLRLIHVPCRHIEQ